MCGMCPGNQPIYQLHLTIRMMPHLEFGSSSGGNFPNNAIILIREEALSAEAAEEPHSLNFQASHLEFLAFAVASSRAENVRRLSRRAFQSLRLVGISSFRYYVLLPKR
jgi:hypothetical protein